MKNQLQVSGFRFQALRIKKKSLLSPPFLLVTCSFWLATCGLGLGTCFAQTEKSDLIVLPDPPFSYYEIIEQRNFFHPRKDNDSQQEEYRSLLSVGEETVKSFKRRGTAGQDAGISDSLSLILTGVIEIRGGYKAIVENKNQAEGYYVSVNDPIEDYIVKDIQRDKLVLEKDAELYELKLERTAKPPDNALNTSTDTAAENENTDSAEYKEDIRLNRMKNLRMGIGGPQ